MSKLHVNLFQPKTFQLYTALDRAEVFL